MFDELFQKINGPAKRWLRYSVLALWGGYKLKRLLFTQKPSAISEHGKYGLPQLLKRRWTEHPTLKEPDLLKHLNTANGFIMDPHRVKTLAQDSDWKKIKTINADTNRSAYTISKRIIIWHNRGMASSYVSDTLDLHWAYENNPLIIPSIVHFKITVRSEPDCHLMEFKYFFFFFFTFSNSYKKQT